jgi:hypothetical protein
MPCTGHANSGASLDGFAPVKADVERHWRSHWCAPIPRPERSLCRRTGPYHDAMATASKRVPPSKGQSPKLPAEPSAPLKPFLRFYHSEALRKKTLSLLSAVEQAQDATTCRDALSNLVVELTNSGMDYYFMKPLKLTKPGFVVEQSASLGLAGVQQVMGSVVRQIIGRMDGPQLISVCGSIRQLML